MLRQVLSGHTSLQAVAVKGGLTPSSAAAVSARLPGGLSGEALLFPAAPQLCDAQRSAAHPGHLALGGARSNAKPSPKASNASTRWSTWLARLLPVLCLPLESKARRRAFLIVSLLFCSLARSPAVAAVLQLADQLLPRLGALQRATKRSHESRNVLLCPGGKLRSYAEWHCFPGTCVELCTSCTRSSAPPGRNLLALVTVCRRCCRK